jgi:hypothetical protein
MEVKVSPNEGRINLVAVKITALEHKNISIFIARQMLN